MIPSTVLHALHEALIHLAAFSMHIFLELHVLCNVFVSPQVGERVPYVFVAKAWEPKDEATGIDPDPDIKRPDHFAGVACRSMVAASRKEILDKQCRIKKIV